MKKIYFSLITIAILLCVGCNNNDVPDNGKAKETGALTATISFDAETASESRSTRAAALSTAIPTVTWDNVKQIQMFLYNAVTGTVAYSKTISPQAGDPSFVYSWTDVPIGTYRLALLANVKSNTDVIDTWVNTEKIAFTDDNVKSKSFNSTLRIDLRESTLPTGHDWGQGVLQKKGYFPPSEIFSAYSENVTIAAGLKTELTGPNKLVLTHEVSLLRARINKEVIPAQQSPIQPPAFNNATDFIVIQTLPVGFGLKAGTFGGGILDAASDKGRVLVCSAGTATYRMANPTTGYKPGTIIDANYKMWQDIRVLPNAALSEGKGKTDNAASGRKYFIIVSGVVQPGYVFANNQVATTVNQPVYWYGEIAGVFTRNVIREVNMALKTAGSPEIPPTPVEYGGLEIELGAPMDWDSTIERTDIDA